LRSTIKYERKNKMKNKLIIGIKIILLIFFSLVWFVLIQAEYEMITKPVLQNDFPIIKGIGAVLFLGFILLILSVIIILLINSLKNMIKSKQKLK